MKITGIMLFVCLLTACNSKTGQKRGVDQNSQKDLPVNTLKKANVDPATETNFELEYNLQSKSGDNIGSVYVKPLLENKEVFSSLIITGYGSSMKDTLYSVKGHILSNKEGVDIKVNDQNLYGYRFVSKDEDNFMLQALHDGGKSVSDNIWVRWDNEKKIYEVDKAP